jgi:hypothetical protein
MRQGVESCAQKDEGGDAFSSGTALQRDEILIWEMFPKEMCQYFRRSYRPNDECGSKFRFGPGLFLRDPRKRINPQSISMKVGRVISAFVSHFAQNATHVLLRLRLCDRSGL